MSTQVTGNVRMSAICMDMLRERLNLPLDPDVLLSHFSMLTTAERIELPALTELLSAQVPTGALEVLAPDAFTRARGLLVGTDPGLTTQRALADSVHEALAEAIDTAGAVIAAEIRNVTADVFAAAGADLGYVVSVCAGATVTGLELRRDHELIVLRVHDGGLIESDHAGLADSLCADRQLALEHAATRRGMSLIDRRVSQHGAVTGGSLISAAVATKDPSLARAVVAMKERPPARTSRRRVGQPEQTSMRRMTRGGAA